MALSIRNEKAEKLAREVAATTGDTLTDSIIHALEEKIERLHGRRNEKDTFRELMEIAGRCSNLPDLDKRTPEEILGYDEHGCCK